MAVTEQQMVDFVFSKVNHDKKIILMPCGDGFAMGFKEHGPGFVVEKFARLSGDPTEKELEVALRELE